jgi:hypothetical protein
MTRLSAARSRLRPKFHGPGLLVDPPELVHVRREEARTITAEHQEVAWMFCRISGNECSSM